MNTHREHEYLDVFLMTELVALYEAREKLWNPARIQHGLVGLLLLTTCVVSLIPLFTSHSYNWLADLSLIACGAFAFMGSAVLLVTILPFVQARMNGTHRRILADPRVQCLDAYREAGAELTRYDEKARRLMALRLANQQADNDDQGLNGLWEQLAEVGMMLKESFNDVQLGHLSYTLDEIASTDAGIAKECATQAMEDLNNILRTARRLSTTR